MESRVNRAREVLVIAPTPAQRRVLLAVVGYIEAHGWPPTPREIADACGLSSPNGVREHLYRLAAKGWLRLGAGRLARAIEVLADPREAADCVPPPDRFGLISQRPTESFSRRIALPPTPAQLRVLLAVAEHIEAHGWPPTRAELADACCRTPNGVQEILRKLAAKGWLRLGPLARQIEVLALPDRSLRPRRSSADSIGRRGRASAARGAAA